MSFIIHYQGMDGCIGSMPSTEDRLRGDLEWLDQNGDLVLKIERFF